MAKKSKLRKFDYFDAFQDQSAYMDEAFGLLQDALEEYDPATLPDSLAKMRVTETAADAVCHSVRERLIIDLLTPIDRADILALSLGLDDVVDDLESILRVFYMYHVQQLDEPVRLMLEGLEQAIDALGSALALMPKYRKKADKIAKKLALVREAEDKVDVLHVEAVHDLYDPEQHCIPATKQGEAAACFAFRQALTDIELCATRIEEAIMCNS